MDYRSMFELGGKTALVAGAASGIGRAGAAGLADFGAHVVCADVDGEGVERTAREIAEGGGSAEAMVVDIEDPASVERARGHVGTPDVIVTTRARTCASRCSTPPTTSSTRWSRST